MTEKWVGVDGMDGSGWKRKAGEWVGGLGSGLTE